MADDVEWLGVCAAWLFVYILLKKVQVFVHFNWLASSVTDFCEFLYILDKELLSDKGIANLSLHSVAGLLIF